MIFWIVCKFQAPNILAKYFNPVWILSSATNTTNFLNSVDLKIQIQWNYAQVRPQSIIDE